MNPENLNQESLVVTLKTQTPFTRRDQGRKWLSKTLKGLPAWMFHHDEAGTPLQGPPLCAVDSWTDPATQGGRVRLTFLGASATLGALEHLAAFRSVCDEDSAGTLNIIHQSLSLARPMPGESGDAGLYRYRVKYPILFRHAHRAGFRSFVDALRENRLDLSQVQAAFEPVFRRTLKDLADRLGFESESILEGASLVEVTGYGQPFATSPHNASAYGLTWVAFRSPIRLTGPWMMGYFRSLGYGQIQSVAEKSSHARPSGASRDPREIRANPRRARTVAHQNRDQEKAA